MKAIRPALYALAALGIFLFWLKIFHDPAVRAEAAKIAADAKADSVRADHDRWKAAFLREDSARGDSLAKLARDVTSAHVQISRLRARVIRRDSLPESADTLRQQVAVRDSIIERQDSTIALQHDALTLAAAMLAARDTLIAHQQTDLKALLVSRDTWRKVAERRWFCVGGVGGTLGISGNAAIGAGFTCGIVLR